MNSTQETIFDIVESNVIISETLYCLYKQYDIDDETIQFCLESCIESENYELCHEFKVLYEKIHGVDTFKKFNS